MKLSTSTLQLRCLESDFEYALSARLVEAKTLRVKVEGERINKIEFFNVRRLLSLLLFFLSLLFVAGHYVVLEFLISSPCIPQAGLSSGRVQ